MVMLVVCGGAEGEVCGVEVDVEGGGGDWDSGEVVFVLAIIFSDGGCC